MIKFNHTSTNVDVVNNNPDFAFLDNKELYHMRKPFMWIGFNDEHENYLCLKYPELLTKITKEN